MNFGNINTTVVVDEELSLKQSSVFPAIVMDYEERKILISSTEWFKKFRYCRLWCSHKPKYRLFYQPRFQVYDHSRSECITSNLWTQILILQPLSDQNWQLAGYLFSRNCSNFLYVQAPSTYLYDCSQLLSCLFEANRRFDSIPNYYQDTVTFSDPKKTIFYLCYSYIPWKQSRECLSLGSWSWWTLCTD